MALSFTTNIGRPGLLGKGVRTWKVGGGLKVAQVEMTSSATGDYSSGYDLTGNASKMGFSAIFDVVSANIRQSNGTIRALTGLYDHNTGKLRFYKTGATTSAVLLELVAGSDLAANDVIRMTVIGV